MWTRDAIAHRFGTTGYDTIAKQACDLLKRVDARFQGRTWPTERAELGNEATAKVLFRLSCLKYVKIKGGSGGSGGSARRSVINVIYLIRNRASDPHVVVLRR